MARGRSAGLLLLPMGAMSSTPAVAGAVDLLQAEAPILELLAISLAATASVATLFSRQWMHGLRAALADVRLPRRQGTTRIPAPVEAAYSRAVAASGWVPAAPGSTVVARTLRSADIVADDWDQFAQRCGASYRSAHCWLRAWSIKSSVRYQLRRFEFFREGRKIGQCAVAVGKREMIFLDRLLLLPGEEAVWRDAMESVLQALGSGRYVYGWDLSLEVPREHDLRTIGRVTIDTTRPLTVHVVDFAQWRSWDEFWRSTSANTRRNAKRAEKEGIRVAVRRGHESLSHVAPLLRLRAAMSGRKGLRFTTPGVLASYIGTYLTCRTHSVSAVAWDGTAALAGFSGMEFGNHTYYVDGGSRPANKGAAWYVQSVMLKRAWERTAGRGKFVLGYVDYDLHDDTVSGGLIRSRKAVRAVDVPTSIVTFSYG